MPYLRNSPQHKVICSYIGTEDCGNNVRRYEDGENCYERMPKYWKKIVKDLNR